MSTEIFTIKKKKVDGTFEKRYPRTVSSAVYAEDGGSVEATLKTIAPVYDSTKTYLKDAIVRKNGKLYQSNVAITTAEVWNVSHWTEISLEIAKKVCDIASKILEKPTTSGTQGQVLALDANGKTIWKNDEKGTTVVVVDNLTTDDATKALSAKQGKVLETSVEELMSEVFPLEVSYASQNSGTREVGISVTPQATLNITRKGTDVSKSATLNVPTGTTKGADNKSWTASAISSGTYTYNASVVQGGQTKSLPTLTYTFTNYRYRGEVPAIPDDYATAIKALATKELSTNATLGATNLSANKYYLFAVKGSATLVCRENSSNAIVSGCVTGTAIIAQENDSTKTNSYSYILVPKSGSVWTFKITNS